MANGVMCVRARVRACARARVLRACARVHAVLVLRIVVFKDSKVVVVVRTSDVATKRVLLGM